MSPKIRSLVLLAALVLVAATDLQAQTKRLRIGVTLHPYYSWVANVAGDTADVVPVIPPGSDPHSYQPQPQDLAALADLDAVVVNLLGHDDFVLPMLKAAGRENLPRIEVNKGVPTIPAFQKTFAFEEKEGSASKKVAANSHTYLSIVAATQQVNTIAEALAKLRPADADVYRKNALAYNKRLRALLGDALKKLSGRDTSKIAIATVHDGYAYLLQDLGLKTAAVVQPRHGIEPSARQLADTIAQIKNAHVNVLFAEADYERKFVDTIFEETKCRVFKLRHVSTGPYTSDKFEKDMKANLDTVVEAVLTP